VIIDSSALLAILQDEPESLPFRQKINSDPTRLASAPTILEASIVSLTRHGEAGLAKLRAFIDAAGIEIVAFTPEHMDIAVEAFRQFGKGRHKAGLNFGDCMSYALARATREALLFKGDDFGLTDVEQA
jgi:ribonuclease VapC